MSQEEIREALKRDFRKLYVKEFTTSWEIERVIRETEIDVMSLDNLEALLAKPQQPEQDYVNGALVEARATPYPGRDKAIEQGCICPIMDNQAGVGGMLQRPVINLNCPLHGDNETKLEGSQPLYKEPMYKAQQAQGETIGISEPVFYQPNVTGTSYKQQADPDREKMQHLFCQHCRAIQKVMNVQAECWYNPLDREAPAFCASNEDTITEIKALFNPDEIRRQERERILAVIDELSDYGQLLLTSIGIRQSLKQQ